MSFSLREPSSQRLSLVFGVLIVVVAAYSESFLSMWQLWQTSDYRHGLLVLPISAFLIWRLRGRLAEVPMAVDWRGLLVVTPLVAAWGLSRLSGVQVVEHFVSLSLIPATVFVLGGFRLLHLLCFPMLFMLFGTPLGESLVPMLMQVTADISTGLLRLTGIPVLRDGQFISLPGGEFVVADVCSGLRYLIAGVMIALLFGYLNFRSVAKRVLFVVLTGIALIVTNGIRAYIVMAVASATEMQYLGGRDHIYFGWLLFGIVIALLMWAGGRYADPYADPEKARPAGNTLPVTRASSTVPLVLALMLVMLAVTVKPLQKDFGEVGAAVAAAAALAAFGYFLGRGNAGRQTFEHADAGTAGPVTSNILVLGLLLTFLVGVPWYVQRTEALAVSTLETFEPQTLDGCFETGSWVGQWRPRFQNPDREGAAALDCNGVVVSVYVATYASALQGRELISSANQPAPVAWDRHTDRRTYGIESADGTEFEVVESHVDIPGYRALTWYWYEVDGALATSRLRTKALQVRALLLRRAAGGSVFVLETPVTDGVEKARQHLGVIAEALVTREAAIRVGAAR